MFSEQELSYLQTHPLARLATVTSDGQPDVDAVGFEFDGARFYIGGRQLRATRKYKNVASGNLKVSLIIDDLVMSPWEPRGIKLHGIAEIVEREGRFGFAPYIAITPTVSWSWGIEGSFMQGGRYAPKKILWHS
ncbi:MAG: PPOX class F420-dependent oxidoreductase [Verrucomicrobia bacterium]|nr:PPOX class F420-dependent oxidoreductase [Verrucomicrobiota bacterium]